MNNCLIHLNLILNVIISKSHSMHFSIIIFCQIIQERDRDKRHYEIIFQWKIEKNIRQVLSADKKKVEGPDVNIECCWYNNGIILYQFKEQKMLLNPRVLYWKERNLSSFL